MNEWTKELEQEFGWQTERFWRTQHGPWPVAPGTPTRTLDEMRVAVANSPLIQREFRIEKMRGASYGDRWTEDPGTPNV